MNRPKNARPAAKRPKGAKETKKPAEAQQTPDMTIQWYPGHMAKTRRLLQEQLRLVDMAVEVIDARIPVSSRNPDLDVLLGEKPRLILLNRADQADAGMNAAWAEVFRARGIPTLQTDCKTGLGVRQFPAAARALLAEKLRHWEEQGKVGRPIRAMVVGIPNVGKSTFINQAAGRKAAAAENRPGLTRGKQWVTVDGALELLDTPGILWPKFEDPEVGFHLACTGAVKDTVLDTETLAAGLIALLARRYPGALTARYGIAIESGMQGWELLEAAGRKRGFLSSGGKIDTERMSRVLLEEFRSGKLGRFTLEAPPRRDKNEPETGRD